MASLGNRYGFFSQKMLFESKKVDWALAEQLAYGTLMLEGYNVRISGQDVERGTFSHRHAVLKSEDFEEEYLPLNNIDSNKKGVLKIQRTHIYIYIYMCIYIYICICHEVAIAL